MPDRPGAFVHRVHRDHGAGIPGGSPCFRSDGICFINMGDSYSSATYVMLRKDLSAEDEDELLQIMSRSAGKEAGQGPLQAVLSEALEKEQLRARTGTQLKLLSEKQDGISCEDQRGAQATPHENDGRSWWEVCVLWRDGKTFPVPRSYQGRRSLRVSENGRTARRMEEGNSRGVTQRQISPALLELQRRTGALRFLSSLQFDISDISSEARQFFEVILKPKDLCGIPWRLAFALQADGWYLRSDIIWSKPNPMPESVTDRPTKAHEYLFLLSKSERYYYDAEAIKETNAESTVS